jgi:outer membrane protein assembly factor BamB
MMKAHSPRPGRRAIGFAAAALCCSLAATGTARADDWPQYRFDAGRTAASPETLPASMSLMWERHMPAPCPAFPGSNRLRFDATYEPVVMGKTMFVPSMVTDSVTALDTETGRQLWQFLAEGPIRLAPAAGQGKVYFVCDDGDLYCVGAADGKLLWKFRGLPAGRADRRLIGDGRLVSVFPARGGPVLAGGIVYFAAGIWSDEGVFVHALNAETGKVVWSNTDSDKIANANADHGVGGVTGISPQGHLAVVDGTLIVPCGAQLPALIDARTGKLHTYTMGHGGKFQQPKGCSFASGVGKYLFHAGDVYDMSQVGKGSSLNDEGQRFDKLRMLYPGALTRLQIDPANEKELGDFRDPVLTPEAMYCQQDGIVACDLKNPRPRKNAPADAGIDKKALKDSDDDDDGGGKQKGKRFVDSVSIEFPELWKLPGESKVHIKAGGRLYCGKAGAIEAVDIPNKGLAPKVSWRASVQGTAHRMLAADGKLFVVTLEGRIYAFGSGKPTQPAVHTSPTPKPAPGQGTTGASGILRSVGVADGYVLALGLADARLAEEIVRQSRCDVIVVEADAAKAADLRERFAQAGLYGSRITVLAGDWPSLGLPPYMASLIVLGEPDVAAKASDLAVVKLLYRSLRPYGGACMGIPPAGLQAAGAAITAGDLKGAAIVRRGDLVLLGRQGPLADSADWSHAGANAANTGASLDRLIKPPLKRLWFDGSDRWYKKLGSIRVAGGRLLVASDDLCAIDAYTGRRLWQSPAAGGDKLVATEDAIYMPGSRGCTVLDPATGKESRQMAFPGEAKGAWSLMSVAGDIIVGAGGDRLVCIDRKTGKTLWGHQCEYPVGSIAVGGGKVFCTNAVNRRRTSRTEGAPQGWVTALDARSGKLLWKIASAGEILYGEPYDVVLLGVDVPKGMEGVPNFNSASRMKKFTAHRGADGQALWEGIAGTQAFIVGDKVVTYLTRDTPKHALVAIYDLMTGQKAAKDIEWYQRGCTVLRAGSNLLTTRYLANAAYYDLADGKMTPISNVRASCSNNLYPANGVLAAPNLIGGCNCNYMPISQGFAPVAAFE